MSQGEPEILIVEHRAFFRVARDASEYVKDVVPTSELLSRVRSAGADVFTFLQREWCFKLSSVEQNWVRVEDNVAIIEVSTYDSWLKSIGKKTRNMIRKAEKCGITTKIVTPGDGLAEGIWKIYNESPIRQDRGFPHYGTSLEAVKRMFSSPFDCTYIGAYFEGQLAGFIQLVHGSNVTLVSQILSLQKFRDCAVNNALIARVIEFCADRRVTWVVYGRMGNHPSLDDFKESNGFGKLVLSRYYVPLTRKGKLAVRLGLHRQIKDVVPMGVKIRLFPYYNWVSRTRMRLKLLFRGKRS